MGLFHRSCSVCGERPRPKVATRLNGHNGDADVEFTNFPYRSCSCGKLAKWAFDPGTDLSTQLFWDKSGIPRAKGTKRAPVCARCGTILGAPEQVELAAQVRLKGFEPIDFRTRLQGFVCQSCGLAQAPRGSFDRTKSGGPVSDGARALDDAVRSIGLPR